MYDNSSREAPGVAETIARRHPAAVGNTAEPVGVDSPPTLDTGTVSEVSSSVMVAHEQVDEVLFAEEAVRSRGFSLVTVVLVSIVMLELPWLAGSLQDLLGAPDRQCEPEEVGQT